MKIKQILIGVCCFFYIGIQAQTTDNLQKELDNMLSGMQMEMNLFTKQIHKDFYQLVEEQDKAFQQMLEQNWQEFQLFSGMILEGGKKPPHCSGSNPK